MLSPARLDGERGRALFAGGSQLAERLRSPAGATVEEVFTFVSSLYFRGKAAYARSFGRAPSGKPAAHVISAGGGLLSLDDTVTVERLRGWRSVAVHEDNPHFVAPLERHASALIDAHAAATRFVLLGSVASKKYVVPLLGIFGERLLFPSELEGRGDMSRGALLLAAVRAQRELSYAPLLHRRSARRLV